MRKILFITFFAWAVIALVSPASDAAAQSTSDPHICLKTCIETYGSTKKQACALQCGLGSGSAGGGQSRDCGALYKQCLTQCRADEACKSTCRKQRTSCY